MDFLSNGTEDGNSLGDIDESHTQAGVPCKSCETAKQQLAVPKKGKGRPRTIRCLDCILKKKEADREKARLRNKKHQDKRRLYTKAYGDGVAGLNQMRLDNGNEPKGKKPCKECMLPFEFHHTRQVRCDRCQDHHKKDEQE